MSLEALNEQISYVSQEQFLFNTSLRENIRMGKPGATDEEVDAELAKMAEQYNMEVEKLKEMFAEEDLKSIRDDLAVQKAVELVTDAAVEK